MKKILLINPNSSEEMTGDIAATVESLALDNYGIKTVRMENSPRVLESFADYTLAGAEVLRYLAAGFAGDADGVLLACFGDPALYALKEVSPVPVIGIAEAALSTALLLGFKFSIVASSPKAVPMMESLVKSYGLEGRLASVECLDMPIESFLGNRSLTAGPLTRAAGKAVAKGAEVLVLGCAGLTMLEKQVEEKYRITVIDPVRAGIFSLLALLEGGFRVSKTGLYAP
jgi:allantoin racemase